MKKFISTCLIFILIVTSVSMAGFAEEGPLALYWSEDFTTVGSTYNTEKWTASGTVGACAEEGKGLIMNGNTLTFNDLLGDDYTIELVLSTAVVAYGTNWYFQITLPTGDILYFPSYATAAYVKGVNGSSLGTFTGAITGYSSIAGSSANVHLTLNVKDGVLNATATQTRSNGTVYAGTLTNCTLSSSTASGNFKITAPSMSGKNRYLHSVAIYTTAAPTMETVYDVDYKRVKTDDTYEKYDADYNPLAADWTYSDPAADITVDSAGMALGNRKLNSTVTLGNRYQVKGKAILEGNAGKYGPMMNLYFGSDLYISLCGGGDGDNMSGWRYVNGEDTTKLKVSNDTYGRYQASKDITFDITVDKDAGTITGTIVRVTRANGNVYTVTLDESIEALSETSAFTSAYPGGSISLDGPFSIKGSTYLSYVEYITIKSQPEMFTLKPGTSYNEVTETITGAVVAGADNLENVTYIVAMYDATNKLLCTQLYPFAGKETNINLADPTESTPALIKIFVWDSIDSLKPYTEPFIAYRSPSL